MVCNDAKVQNIGKGEAISLTSQISLPGEDEEDEEEEEEEEAVTALFKQK